ncbi:MAG TPA: efflux RND transporter permease subunit [Thermoanaerobaculia bacterium]|nr:efflux RND transporter permease subunit [Thermoanaerobaculia bacterium]
MAVAAISVRRPIAVLMVTLAICTFGFLASQRLPVELLPDLSYPTLTVQTEYPDAAPLSVEQFVTRPLEEAVGVISGVREMRSVSRPGLSEVILEFDWGEDMDFAAIEVRERLGVVQLPREASVPRVLRFDPSLEPIVRLGLTGDRPLDDLRQLADRWLRPRLEGVTGIAAVKVRGGLDAEVVVAGDEDRLAALGLTLDDLARALQAENVNVPGGVVRDFNALYLVRTLHEFTDLRQLRQTVVRQGPQGRVRVEDVADVRRWHRDREEISRLQGKEVVELALHREGSANTVATAEALRAELDELRGEMPRDLELMILSDQSRFIAEAIDQVENAAWLGGLLAVLMLYFFLRDAPSTLIIALSIPVSVVATFLPMYQAGVSLNIMSLGGLALGVGMLVDSSIVVLEAVDRHRALGAGRRQAAVAGASEVAGAVTASTLTTVAVFFPIVFVKGVAGQLFRDQALTVCFSLLASLAVALTVIPALAAVEVGRGRSLPGTRRTARSYRIGRFELAPMGDGVSRKSRLLTALLLPVRLLLLALLALLALVGAGASRLFFLLTSPLARLTEGLSRRYPRALERALRRRWAVLGAAALLLALSITAMPLLGTRLMPELGQGEFAFQLRLPEGTPLTTTSGAVARIEGLLLDDPRFARIVSTIGSLPSTASGRRTLGENLAQIDFVLPPEAPGELQDAAVARVRRVLDHFPRIEAELAHPAVLTVEPAVGVRLLADDLALLDGAAERVQAALAEIPGVTDVTTTSEPGNPEVRVELDRERAATVGLSAADIGNALRRKVAGEVIGEFREGEERIDIRLRSRESFRDQASDIADLRLRLGDGTVVPVSAVAAVRVDRGPASIHRARGSRMAEVTAEARTADLGSVLAAVERRIGELDLPPQVRAEMSGQNQELEVSFASLRLALVLAVFLVYVVMAAQFESLLHPFVILFSVPLALVGVVASLLFTGHQITVLALIGSVMLAGIVVNNAIVLVDSINRRRREGQRLVAAVVHAGHERLRPILMTTATTVLGLLPMALGLRAGNELRAPLAITVIGGLLAATLLTLVVIPCVYLVFARAAAAIAGGTAGAGEAGADWQEETQPALPMPAGSEDRA